MDDHLREGRHQALSNTTRQRICAVNDIEDGESAGFAVEKPDGSKIGIMAIRQGDEVFLYENNCPHIGAPLDFEPGQFLDLDREFIICSTHGALFRIKDGYCISGPCMGDHLTAIEAVVEDGAVFAAVE